MRLLKCIVFFAVIVLFAFTTAMPFWHWSWYEWTAVLLTDLVLLAYWKKIMDWAASWMMDDE